MRLPSRVSLVEVGLRDGLQLVGRVIPVEAKLRLLKALYTSGLRAMEVTSFVSPRAVPQFADAETVARAALALPGLHVSALIPNNRGLERALAAGVRHLTFVVGATDQFNRANVRMTVEESLAQLAAITETLRAFGPAGGSHSVTSTPSVPGTSVEVGIAVAFGCPYTGSVPFDSVRGIVERAVALGAEAVSLGDTIGVATPRQVASAVTDLKRAHPALTVSLHLHDTRGTGLANVLAGLDAGVTTFDASVGGLGGCPFAPGATGNIATDDLNYMLLGMGIATGVDQTALLECGRLVHEMVTTDLPSHTLRVHLGRPAV